MASGIGNVTAQWFANNFFGSAAAAAPTSFNLALYTVSPTWATGAGGTEVSGGNYSRVAVPANSTNWPVISGAVRTLVNGVDITLSTPSADWGMVVSFGLWNGAVWVGGGTLDVPISLTANSNNKIPAGSLSITFP